MGSFKMGGMTLRSLFGKPETLLYPLEQKEPALGLKGHIENDMEVCILCGMCVKACPASALDVDRDAKTWSINRYRCVQCASCTRVCPKSCLRMEPTYQKPAATMNTDVFSQPEPSAEELAEKEARKAAKLEAALKAKAEREKN